MVNKSAQNDILEAHKANVLTTSQANAFLLARKQRKNEKKKIIACVIEYFDYSLIPYKSGNRRVIKEVLSTELRIDISVVQKRITEHKKEKIDMGLMRCFCLYKKGIICAFSVQNHPVLRKKGYMGGDNINILSMTYPETPLLLRIISNIRANLRQDKSPT
jgi:hypothetical protein